MEKAKNKDLFLAVKSDIVEWVRERLEEGVDPNDLSECWDRAFNNERNKNRVEIMKLLVQYGANAKDYNFIIEMFGADPTVEILSYVINYYDKDLKFIKKLF